MTPGPGGQTQVTPPPIQNQVTPNLGVNGNQFNAGTNGFGANRNSNSFGLNTNQFLRYQYGAYWKRGNSNLRTNWEVFFRTSVEQRVIWARSGLSALEGLPDLFRNHQNGFPFSGKDAYSFPACPKRAQISELHVTRRQFLEAAGFAALGAASGTPAISALAGETVTMPFANGQRSLAKFPQKRALILVTTRPPQLETPFSVFNEGVITPNDAFFVRYHLAEVPTSINPETFKIEIKGKVNSPTTLSLAHLKTKFEPVDIVAVNQCFREQPRIFESSSRRWAIGKRRDG